MSDADDAAFEALLEFLKGTRGVDFTGYKRPSLQRRFRRRMDDVGCESFGDYLDYLQVTPERVPAALRDAADQRHRVLPRRRRSGSTCARRCCRRCSRPSRADEPVRVWSAGCATGQEAYTCAIVLAELLGVDAYRERVKIYGTDIDEDALTYARLAIYSAKETESLPAELRERYFEGADHRLAFRNDLRRTVIFGRNNLVQDAPISRLDLLVCRNTLMYFNAETQSRILRHFHFALVDSGALMLGKSEMMITHRELFAAGGAQAPDLRQAAASDDGASRAASFSAGEAAPQPNGDDERTARDAALELGAQAHAIVSRSGRLMFANLPARALFRISREDSAGRWPSCRWPRIRSRCWRRSNRRCASAAAWPSARSRSRRTAATRAGSRSASRRCCRPTTSRSRPASSSRT